MCSFIFKETTVLLICWWRNPNSWETLLHATLVFIWCNRILKNPVKTNWFRTWWIEMKSGDDCKSNPTSKTSTLLNYSCSKHSWLSHRVVWEAALITATPSVCLVFVFSCSAQCWFSVNRPLPHCLSLCPCLSATSATCLCHFHLCVWLWYTFCSVSLWQITSIISWPPVRLCLFLLLQFLLWMVAQFDPVRSRHYAPFVSSFVHLWFVDFIKIWGCWYIDNSPE